MTYRTKFQDGQIAVPSRLKRLAGLTNGVPLDITYEQGKFVVVRKVAASEASKRLGEPQRMKRTEEFLQQLREAASETLRGLWAESERKGLDKSSLREINAEIAAYRKVKRQRKEPVIHPVR